MSKDAPITAEDRWTQGEDRTLTVACVDAAGLPLNLTGYTLAWYLFSRATEGRAVLISIANAAISRVDVSGTADGARFTLAASLTVNAGAQVIAPGTYWHELWRVDASNSRPLATGAAVLLASGRR